MRRWMLILLVLALAGCGGGTSAKPRTLSAAERAKAEQACKLMSDHPNMVTPDEYSEASKKLGYEYGAGDDMQLVCPAEAQQVLDSVSRQDNAELTDDLASQGPTDTSSEESFVAQQECENFVKERLKSPSSADFSKESRGDAGGHQYVITGDVDAQNSFGAQLRSSWSCTVTILGNQARLDDITLS